MVLQGVIWVLHSSNYETGEVWLYAYIYKHYKPPYAEMGKWKDFSFKIVELKIVKSIEFEHVYNTIFLKRVGSLKCDLFLV